MLRRFRRTCPVCGRPGWIPFPKQARVSPWQLNTDLFRGKKRSEGEQEAKKNKNGHETRRGIEAE